MVGELDLDHVELALTHRREAPVTNATLPESLIDFEIIIAAWGELSRAPRC